MRPLPVPTPDPPHRAMHPSDHVGANPVEQLPEDGWDPAGDARELVRRVATWPALRTERRRGRIVLRSRASGSPVGELDPLSGVLTVDADPGRVAALLAQHPRRVEAAPHGVRLDVRQERSHRLAEDLLHRRVRELLFVRQALIASP